MSFQDILFSPAISYGAVGGVEFSTTVVRSTSGYEQRNINWEMSGGQWDVAQTLKFQSELDDLIAFFRARRGKAYSFRFLDWTDYDIAAENCGSFDGTPGTTVQIQKTYTDDGGYTQIRTITKPVDVTDSDHTLDLADPSYTTMTVTIGGAPAVEGVDYSVDYSTGLISDLVGVVGAVVVSCSFHAHARFDTDQMQITIEAYDLNTWGQIPIIELKQAD